MDNLWLWYLLVAFTLLLAQIEYSRWADGERPIDLDADILAMLSGVAILWLPVIVILVLVYILKKLKADYVYDILVKELW